MDDVLIKFAAYVARHMGSTHIYFVHIAQSLDMPKELAKNYRDVLAPIDETICHDLKLKIKELIKLPESCDFSVEVHEGNANDKLLKIVRRKDADVVVLGSKRTMPGQGALAKKLVKSLHRSVVLVPEVLPKRMDQILVAIDFSRHSKLALEKAIILKEASDTPVDIMCYHVYELPSGWSHTGKSEREFSEIMRGHAEKRYQEFIQEFPEEYHNIPCVFRADDNRNPVKEIYSQAVDIQADLIIVGSKGKSAAAAMLMGSVAERLAHRNHEIPLLIVKDKNENIGFLEALFKI